MIEPEIVLWQFSHLMRGSWSEWEDCSEALALQCRSIEGVKVRALAVVDFEDETANVDRVGPLLPLPGASLLGAPP